MDQFWIVMRAWGPGSGTSSGSASAKHATADSAWREAERLTRQENVPFLVLVSVGQTQIAKPPIERITHGPSAPVAEPITPERIAAATGIAPGEADEGTEQAFDHAMPR